MIVEPKEEKGSILWKTVEQVYRFGLGSVAGGEWFVVVATLSTEAKPLCHSYE